MFTQNVVVWWKLSTHISNSSEFIIARESLYEPVWLGSLAWGAARYLFVRKQILDFWKICFRTIAKCCPRWVQNWDDRLILRWDGDNKPITPFRQLLAQTSNGLVFFLLPQWRDHQIETKCLIPCADADAYKLTNQVFHYFLLTICFRCVSLSWPSKGPMDSL